jgi:Holliday junction DNA helicase RuvA
MISAITGELREVLTDRVQLACGPMVYEILVPAADIGDLQSRSGDEITFHTIYDLEGDPTRGGLTPRLIGFLREADKRFFQLFITVKGIGPKRALRALVEPAGAIAQAIEAKNTRFLVELPEIGKRTAEQIVAELAGKVTEFAMLPVMSGGARSAAGGHTISEREAIDAAVQLGINRSEAEHLLDRARQQNAGDKPAETLLREMLRLRTVRM